jgi:hypothetical protein
MKSFAVVTPHIRLTPVQWTLLGWALTTTVVGLLPEGVGGGLRAFNALLFLSLGPGCALMLLLIGVLPLATALVVALGSSLGVLLLTSQLLLLMSLWRDWSVTALVALVTVALVIAASRNHEEG